MQDVFDTLKKWPKFGSGIGLHRMDFLCRDILPTKWAQNISPIHVTGSNGKGSVSKFIAEILKNLNYKTGLYTSPHLVKFHERFCINGKMISDQALQNLHQWLLQQQTAFQTSFPNQQIGAFEAFTAMGLQYFLEQHVEALVLEAGIGGRYDSTRILPGLFNVLTSLDLEHTSLLGNSLDLIGCDKIDISCNGGYVFTGRLPTDLLHRLSVYASLRDITCISIEDFSDILNVTYQDGLMKADLQIDDLHLENITFCLPGTHQIDNFILAVKTVKEWLQHQGKKISDPFIDILYETAQTTKWPGRIEKIHQNPDIYIDVAHSPDAIQKLTQTVKHLLPDQKILLITGVSFNKDIDNILGNLVPVANKIICAKATHHGSEVQKIQDSIVRQYPNIPVTSMGELEHVIPYAKKIAKEENMTILVAGSLFLAIECKMLLQEKNAKELNFF